MDKSEYLVASVAGLKFGIFCRDVRNVYSEKLNIAKLFYQGQMYRGITNINGNLMQVLDLRRRIGLSGQKETEQLTLISFQTEMSKIIAVVVDEIIGMKRVDHDKITPLNKNVNNKQQNIDLLFPTIAVMEDGDLIHLLDSTYLDKTEPVEEDAGELELF